LYRGHILRVLQLYFYQAKRELDRAAARAWILANVT